MLPSSYPSAVCFVCQSFFNSSLTHKHSHTLCCLIFKDGLLCILLKHCGIPWLSMVLIYISVYRTNRIILCLMCSPNSHGHPAWTPAITPQGPTENIHTVRQPQGSPIPGPNCLIFYEWEERREWRRGWEDTGE